MRNELFCVDQKQSFHTLFTGGRDFFSFWSYTILSKCIEFCFGKILPISKFRGMKNGLFYLIGESLNNFLMKTSNFCMKVERSNFILVPNSTLSTNVFLQSKCNMHGRYDHASWSWCSRIALLEQSSETRAAH